MTSPIEAVTLGEIVAQDYRTAEVLELYGLDYCCGGRRTLREACREAAVDLHTVIAELGSITELPVEDQSLDPLTCDLDRLVDHIVDRHHRFVRAALPAVSIRLDKLVEVHGTAHPELAAIRDHVLTLSSEMFLHMSKEENVLFPYIRALARATRGECEIPANMFGTVQNPIRMMELEHESAGAEMTAIRRLSDDYTTPVGGCSTYAACFAELATFEADLHRHVHLENSILFPRAVELEMRLQRQATQPSLRSEHEP